MDTVGSIISLVGIFFLVVAVVCFTAGIANVVSRALLGRRYMEEIRNPGMPDELWDETKEDKQALALTWALAACCAAIGVALMLLGQSIHNMF